MTLWNKVRKLFANIGFRAYKVLGLTTHIKMLFLLLFNARKIVKFGKMYFLDEAMNTITQPLKIHYNSKNYLFDLAYVDHKLQEGIYYTFGNIREIFILDCYLRYQPKEAFYNARTVLDLGANRGTFSILMTPVAEKIICVEVQSRYEEIIKYNMKLNNFTNYAVEFCFIGEGGLCTDLIKSDNKITLDHIINKYDLHNIDFAKIDIEGSEFALFESPAWLKITKYISMELHHEYGNVDNILNTLKNHDFSYVLVDESFTPISEATQAVHLYAARIA